MLSLFMLETLHISYAKYAAYNNVYDIINLFRIMILYFLKEAIELDLST